MPWECHGNALMFYKIMCSYLHSYFFLGKTDRFSKVCVIFDKLMGARECRDCISSYETDDSCVCNQQNGECRIDSDNFIMFVLLLQPVTKKKFFFCLLFIIFVLLHQPETTNKTIFLFTFFKSCYLKREEAAWLDFFLDCNSLKEL